MNDNPQPPQPDPVAHAEKPSSTTKLFGIGKAGITVVEQLISSGLLCTASVAINTDQESLAASSATEKVFLDTKILRGLGTGGDPERGRELAEEQVVRLKSLCEGAGVVFIVAGLGGGAGTGISPVLARLAKEAGALTLAFVTLPFDCEGSRRVLSGEQGLEELKAAADGVVCLPNQKVLKLIDENTSVLDAFKLANNLLADGVRGIWRLLAHPGLIQIHFDEVCALLRDQHIESVFAVAEAMGPTRSREVLEKLQAHPMLEEGRLLAESDAVLVNFMGGPDLTMAEVNRVMEHLNQQCARAQVVMGTAIDESFRERLAVTLIAARKGTESQPRRGANAGSEELGTQLLPRGVAARPGSRFVPPPPDLPPQKLEQLRKRQAGSSSRKQMAKLRQTQLPLEIISKGRFDKSEPTIHKGEDLDVPTYIRRGVALN